MKLKHLLGLFSALLLFSFQGLAQSGLDYYLPQDVSFNPDIPTPASVIGHEVGEWHITHDRLVQYMRVLAEVSDRITIEEIGETHEARPQVVLTITHPSNHAGIDKIRSDHVWLTYPNEADKFDIKKMPVVAYMGFSIHGNEPSGSNASLLVAYYMAAAQGPKIDQMLRNSVVLLDPSFNPDGLNRFATWANMHKSKNVNPDPADREYSEVWPGGRTNHYWFDLNRDWLPVQQPESRNRISKFHLWKPNVLTDHHEMSTNSTFFFQPGVPSRTHPLTPELNQELTAKIGNYHAEVLDSIGSLYFTEESYDDFYYGKGSTFPDANGGIGILFEQASSRGHAQESEHGVLTFPFTIKNQFNTALSTWKASVDMREELLEYQKDFYKRALREADNDDIEAYIFKAEKDPARAYHLADILAQQEIDFYRPSREIKLDEEVYREDNSYIVPMKQRNYRMVKAMFEKRTEFQDSLFYDISGWTYPMAFNLEYHEMDGRDYSRNQLGVKIDTPLFPQGRLVGDKTNYAYVFDWHGYYAPKAANQLLEKGLRLKVATEPFSLGEELSFDRGAIMVAVQNQSLSPDEIFEEMQSIASENGINIYSLATGLTQGVSLGSRTFETLEKPEVALVVEAGSSYDAGEVWHLLDTRMNMRVTKLPERRVGSNMMDRYNTIIITGGLDLSENDMNSLKRWISKGGTLIGLGYAVNWMVRNGLADLEYAQVEYPETTDISYEEIENYSRSLNIPGGVFNAQLQLAHPMAFGYYREELPIFKRGSVFIEPSESKFANPLIYTEEPLASGWISDANLEAMKGKSSLRVNALGSGRVISIVDNPNFRAFWYGTNKLMMNAIFFGRLVSGYAAR